MKKCQLLYQPGSEMRFQRVRVLKEYSKPIWGWDYSDARYCCWYESNDLSIDNQVELMRAYDKKRIVISAEGEEIII